MSFQPTFIQKGVKYLSNAIEKDKKSLLEEALKFYIISFEYFIAGLKCIYIFFF